jgi:hypothetical protein
MPLQFFRAKPVQACKLAAIVVTLLFAVSGVFGFIPGRGFTGLFGIIFLSLTLALVVAAETLLAGYRSLRAGDSPLNQLPVRQLYVVIRALEVISAIVSMGAFVVLIATLPGELPEGPGAIGLLFIATGIALVVLGGSLLRTLTEYYDYRHTTPA